MRPRRCPAEPGRFQGGFRPFSGLFWGRIWRGPPGPFFFGFLGLEIRSFGGALEGVGRAKWGSPGPPLAAHSGFSPSRGGVYGGIVMNLEGVLSFAQKPGHFPYL